VSGSNDNPLWSGLAPNPLTAFNPPGVRPPANDLASLAGQPTVTPADAYDYNKPIVQQYLADTAQRLQDPRFYVDAAGQWANAMLMGTIAPGMRGVPIRLAKTEKVSGQTDAGGMYDVHVNPGIGQFRRLFDESNGSVRVSRGDHDVAVADASKATHSDIEMALMESDHPMLADMDPEGAERLGLILRGNKGDASNQDVRFGDWNVSLREANDGPRVPLSEWPEGLRRAVGVKSIAGLMAGGGAAAATQVPEQ
jgi:hypothetical protein